MIDISLREILILVVLEQEELKARLKRAFYLYLIYNLKWDLVVYYFCESYIKGDIYG